MIKECKTKLLADSPSEKDAFGSHEKIAKAIAHLILSEEGGKAIALTGSWGVGKSSVVKQLHSEFSKDANSSEAIFVFDTWAHQGDPLRRSFLEELIKFLSKKKWIDSNKWQDKLLEIKRLKEDDITTSFPVVTIWGLLVAIAFLFTPMGYLLLDKFIEVKITWNFLGLSCVYWGLFFLILPFLIVVGRILFAFFSRTDVDKDEIALLFFNKTKDITKSSTTKTIDPTSVEFRDLFKSVVQEALSDRKRKLIVVIDNIDRVSEEEALSVWSTMRTFFEGDDFSSKIENNFWLIVPFDADSIKSIWNKNNKQEKAVSFVDKTFQINFYVPPPVLTNEEKFFSDNIRYAFPDHDVDDFHNVYRLFRLKRSSVSLATPRDVKIFINKLGSLHRQWHDEIPLITQAFYILYENEIREKRLQQFVLEFNDQSIKSLLDDSKWQRNLAGLHYNVEPSKAIHILIEGPIEDALRTGDVEEIKNLNKIEGFLVVCENIVEKNCIHWGENEPTALALCAMALDSLSSKTELGWKKTWSWIKRGAMQVRSWDNFNINIGKGLEAILKYCPLNDRPALSEKILKGISISKFIGEESKNIEWKDMKLEDVQQWVTGVLNVLKAVEQQSESKNLINQVFTVSGDAGFYIQVLSVLKEQNVDEKFIQFFKFKAQNKAVIDRLSQDFESDVLNKEIYLQAIQTMLKIKTEWAWQDFIAVIEKNLSADKDLLQVSVYFNTLFLLAWEGQNELAKVALSKYSNSGYVFHYLNKASDPRNNDVLAECLLIILEHTPNGVPSANVLTSPKGVRKYAEIIASPQSYQDIIKLLNLLLIKHKRVSQLILATEGASSLKAFLTEVFNQLLQVSDSYLYLSSDLIIDHYDYFINLLGEEAFIKHLSLLIEKGNLIEVFKKRDFEVSRISLYLKILKISTDEGFDSLINFLKNHFNLINKEAWSGYFNKEEQILDVLLLGIEKGIKFDFGQEFQDGLIEHSRNILEQKFLPSRLRNNWGLLINVLKDNWRTNFLNNLGDLLTEHELNNKEGLLEIYGDLLIDSDYFEKNGEKVIRRLFTSIIAGARIKEWDWLEKCLIKKPMIMQNSEASTIDTFKERVKNTFTSLDPADDKINCIKGICKLLKIQTEIIVQDGDSAKQVV